MSGCRICRSESGSLMRDASSWSWASDDKADSMIPPTVPGFPEDESPNISYNACMTISAPPSFCPRGRDISHRLRLSKTRANRACSDIFPATISSSARANSSSMNCRNLAVVSLRTTLFFRTTPSVRMMAAYPSGSNLGLNAICFNCSVSLSLLLLSFDFLVSFFAPPADPPNPIPPPPVLVFFLFLVPRLNNKRCRSFQNFLFAFLAVCSSSSVAASNGSLGAVDCVRTSSST
mmetsp:Transcript_5459/g.8588  ORF Transcript_5459/g.8588 Transcript_5459/m.8588 type:complete len:234 (+) Transcript_5459:446-1147(+)